MEEFTFETIMARVAELAAGRDDVVSVGMFGSRARVTRPADETRYFEQWAGEETAAQFSSIFAAYDQHDITRAIRATAELFSQVARETGELLGEEYPFPYEESAVAFLESCR